jgi:rare lipoprotein A
MLKNSLAGALALAMLATPALAETPAQFNAHRANTPHIASVFRGLASYYGAGEPLQKHTASGAVFKPLGFTAAHRTLPLGTRLSVRLGSRTVVVTVNDRGPAAWTHREIDLSLGAARAIGLTAKGVARVEIAVLK